MLFKRFRKKHESYDLRKEVAAWVKKNIGADFVEEALVLVLILLKKHLINTIK